jgi:hypothetical protein
MPCGNERVRQIETLFFKLCEFQLQSQQGLLTLYKTEQLEERQDDCVSINKTTPTPHHRHSHSLDTQK